MGGGGKDDRCVGLTNLPPSCADCLEIWESQPPVMGLLYFYLYLLLLTIQVIKLRSMGLAWRVVRMGARRGAYGV